VIYADAYGNAMTGRRYSPDLAGRALMVAGHSLTEAPTFGAVPVGCAFWYCNSMDLVEIAVNRGFACERLKLKVGTEICFSG
jgi:S-adenosylmethionine hydrolase